MSLTANRQLRLLSDHLFWNEPHCHDLDLLYPLAAWTLYIKGEVLTDIVAEVKCGKDCTSLD
jgi:hypothetical protein